MSTRHILILLIILGLLAGAAVLQKIISKMPPEQTGFIQTDARFTISDISRIEMMSGNAGGRVMLEKMSDTDGAAWMLRGAKDRRAQSWKVEYLISVFSLLTGEVRAHSQDFFPEFGLTSDKAFRIAFINSEENKKSLFWVSPDVGNPGGSFYREESSDNIYRTDWDLLMVMGVFEKGLEERFWLDYPSLRDEK